MPQRMAQHPHRLRRRRSGKTHLHSLRNKQIDKNLGNQVFFVVWKNFLKTHQVSFPQSDLRKLWKTHLSTQSYPQSKCGQYRCSCVHLPRRGKTLGKTGFTSGFGVKLYEYCVWSSRHEDNARGRVEKRMEKTLDHCDRHRNDHAKMYRQCPFSRQK